MEKLSLAFNRVRDLLSDVVRPHMQTKNLDMLVRLALRSWLRLKHNVCSPQTEVFNFYGDGQFLQALLRDPSFAECRSKLAVREPLPPCRSEGQKAHVAPACLRAQENMVPILQDIRRQVVTLSQAPKKCYLKACVLQAVPPVGLPLSQRAAFVSPHTASCGSEWRFRGQPLLRCAPSGDGRERAAGLCHVRQPLHQGVDVLHRVPQRHRPARGRRPRRPRVVARVD